jgi:CRP/FNR family transcriptional regulator, cyclic AMP receptor protein
VGVDGADAVPEGGFLSRLTPLEAADLADRARKRRFARGDVIFTEGEAGDEVVLLTSGRVKVCGRRSGREVIFSVLDAGAMLGELSAIDGSPRSATVIALEPTQVDAIGIDDFREFLLANPRVSTELLRLLAERLRQASLRQLEFGATQTLTRLCGSIVQMSDRYGHSVEGGVEVVMPLSQQELAGLSGMSREAIVKGLHQLRSLGWLSVDDRTLVVHDLAAIRRRAQTG